MCQPLHAAVVGAGIGGLAFAILARKQGLRVTVLEKTEELTPVSRLFHVTSIHPGLTVLNRSGLAFKFHRMLRASGHNAVFSKNSRSSPWYPRQRS